MEPRHIEIIRPLIQKVFDDYVAETGTFNWHDFLSGYPRTDTGMRLFRRELLLSIKDIHFILDRLKRHYTDDQIDRAVARIIQEIKIK